MGDFIIKDATGDTLLERMRQLLCWDAQKLDRQKFGDCTTNHHTCSICYLQRNNTKHSEAEVVEFIIKVLKGV